MAHDASLAASRTDRPVAGSKSGWRFFPLWLLLSFVVIAAVNATLVWDALSTYPGDAVADDFGTSNRYDRILADADRQAALGWTVTAELSGHLPALTLTGPDGHLLTAATITGKAEHPLGPADETMLTFSPLAPGRYVATAPLPTGRWDLLLRVARDGQNFAVTRRVTVR